MAPSACIRSTVFASVSPRSSAFPTSRESLEDVDVGFAFLSRHRSRSYAFESASAVLAYGREALGLDRVVGIVDAENAGSIRVLEKLGLAFERTIRFAEDDADAKRLMAGGEKLLRGGYIALHADGTRSRSAASR